MRTLLTTAAVILATTFAWGHGSVEIGPNGGRILEFSNNETMHGEVTVKDGQFHIAVLDKEMKPVAVKDQNITATSGTRDNAVKLEVTKTDKGFTIPTVASGQWLILQYKETADTKTITARMLYDTTACGKCPNPEWLCKCPPAK